MMRIEVIEGGGWIIMTGMERLLAFYNSTPQDSLQGAVVRNILSNITRISELSIFDLADLCFTSAASISRLVRRLGYKNYSYFQKDVADCVRKYDSHNRFVDLENKPDGTDGVEYFLDSVEGLYRQFREEMDRRKILALVGELHRAEKVAVYSYSVYFTEVFLQSDLFFSGKICDLHRQESEIFEHVKVLTKKDYVLLMSPDAAEGFDAEKIVEEIHRAGARVCIVTESKRMAGKSRADLEIILPGVKRAVDMYIRAHSPMCVEALLHSTLQNNLQIDIFLCNLNYILIKRLTLHKVDNYHTNK